MANTLRNIGLGLLRGNTADYAGMPVDTLNMLREGLLGPAQAGNPYARALGGLLGPQQAVGSSDWFAQQMGLPQGEGMAYEAARMVSPSPSDVMGLVRRAPIQEIMTYHGTPHRFEPTPENPLGEFMASKIGTGEGAQAYGHGVYLAESPEVARGYRGNLSSSEVILDGKNIGPVQTLLQGPAQAGNTGAVIPGVRTSAKNPALDALSPAEREAIAFIGSEKSIDAAIANLREQAGQAWRSESAKKLWKQRADTLEKLRDRVQVQEGGSLYTSDLPDEMVDRMLDYDKPINEQNDYVKLALENAGINSESSSLAGPMAQGQEKHLQKFGIPGIKYLDAGSRGAKEKATRNFVVFPGEEKKVKILKRE